MPIPEPIKDETVSKYVQRCMSDSVMNREYGDPKQRAAVCYNKYKEVERKRK